MLTFACVRVGDKYPHVYVERLRHMVARHLTIPHRFLCLTDRLTQGCDGIQYLDISALNLPGWFAKMALFNRALMGPGKVVFLDLDMVVAGSLNPLAALEVPFGICRNFTQLRQEREGKASWPCYFGSCAMVLGEGFGHEVWDQFSTDPAGYMQRAGQYGDQWIIEKIGPAGAVLLQEVLPPGYFLHYRDFTHTPDPRAAVLVFAGNTKPATCEFNWIREEWTRIHERPLN